MLTGEERAMTRRRIFSTALAAFALTTALASGARAQERCGDQITAFSPVSVEAGRKVRLSVFNGAAPDPTDQKAGAADVTLRFDLYRPGFTLPTSTDLHTRAGERSSGRLTLAAGQGASLDFTDWGAGDTWTFVRPVVLGHSSLPGGSAAPLRLTLEIIDVGTGRANPIMVDGAETWFCRR
jgi:hypothetical protein